MEMYWNKCKTKSENKNATKEYRFFFESKFVRVNRFFVLVYSNKDNNKKKYKTGRNYLISMQFEGIRTFCLPGIFLDLSVLGHFASWNTLWGLGVLGHFGLKYQTRKINKILKDFELYQVLMCQTVLIFLNTYIIYKKN